MSEVDAVHYGVFESPWAVITKVLFNSGERPTVALGTYQFEMKPVAVDNVMTYYHIPNMRADGIVCLRSLLDVPQDLAICRNKEYYHASKPVNNVDFTGFSASRYLPTSIENVMMFDMYNNLGSSYLGYEPYIARSHIGNMSENDVLPVEVTFAWLWPQELREQYTQSTMAMEKLYVKSWSQAKTM